MDALQFSNAKTVAAGASSANFTLPAQGSQQTEPARWLLLTLHPLDTKPTDPIFFRLGDSAVTVSTANGVMLTLHTPLKVNAYGATHIAVIEGVSGSVGAVNIAALENQ